MKAPAPKGKRKELTKENEDEAARLLAIWTTKKRELGLSQASFGHDHDIGNQSAVGQFLKGRTALSKKAAIGFAHGLGVSVEEFSPRLAEEVARGVAVSSPEMVRRSVLTTVAGAGSSLAASAHAFARYVSKADDLTREQIKPLLAMMCEQPNRSEEIASRIVLALQATRRIGGTGDKPF